MNFRLFAVLIFLAPSIVRAEVSLPKVFSSHMVLQREMPIHIWGFAAPAEQVSIDFHWFIHSCHTPTRSDAGVSIFLHSLLAVLLISPCVPPIPSSSMTFLLGDLWIASGQSNMEMPLAGFSSAPIKDSEREIASANQPQIRLLRVIKDTSAYPLDDVKEVKAGPSAHPRAHVTFPPSLTSSHVIFSNTRKFRLV